MLTLLLHPAALASAQQPDGWDSPRALELIARARDRRAGPRADSGLVSYKATAGGYVYFYLDRKDSQERTLVKVDQLALEVYWAAPDQTKQRIVGLRDVSRLPNRQHYHLDHLTVVQDEFGDVIRLGDGDEVKDVPHPAAPGADSVYQFRLADSLTLQLPGAQGPVRVYHVDVRPRRFDRPAFIGAVFVDRGTADIVRMTFTFTPVSYVDRRLDYINISLDNALWEGRYWLPHEQRVEIRRQLPELDFPAGGVIRGSIRVEGYEFNQPLAPELFQGPRVTALPKSAREAHAFETGLLEGLAEEGLAPPPSMADLRKQAVELIGKRYLSGLPRVRLHLPNASSALRYNRAEGLYLGAGAAYATGASTTLETSFGWAFGAEHPPLAAVLRHQASERTGLRLGGHFRALRDLGPVSAAPGALNTLAGVFAGEDYLDPYFASGLTAGATHRLRGPWQAELSLTAEEHGSARLEAGDSLEDRPVRPIDEGLYSGARAALRRDADRNARLGWSGELSVEAGRLDPEAFPVVPIGHPAYRTTATFARPMLQLGLAYRTLDGRLSVDTRAAAGVALGDPPAQRLFLLGGRHTLPGHPYRAFGGDRFALLAAEAAREAVRPWLAVRALAAVGWTRFAGAAPPGGWGVRDTDGARASFGLGLGLIYDILRLDLVRGLDGGDTELIFSINPRLWDIL